jgi:hypothetical protein
MATRSMVGMKTETGEVVASYIHYDGYLSGVGRTLVEHYTDPKVVKDLCEVGYLRSLKDTLDESYADSGWDNEDYALYLYDSDYLEEAWDNYGVDFIYLYDNGTWNYATHDVRTFQPV